MISRHAAWLRLLGNLEIIKTRHYNTLVRKLSITDAEGKALPSLDLQSISLFEMT